MHYEETVAVHRGIESCLIFYILVFSHTRPRRKSTSVLVHRSHTVAPLRVVLDTLKPGALMHGAHFQTVDSSHKDVSFSSGGGS